jgi:ABC-2 type transport system ATP-binding protein
LEVITVKNLKKTYVNGNNKVVAVDDLSFSVPQGSIYGFLGPNGAGKSTTIGILLQFIYQDQGEIYLFGEPIKNNFSNLKKRLSFIPDADLPNINGLQLLKHTGKFYGLNGENLRKRIIEVAKSTDIKPFVDRNTKRLSKGQKTRIKIANAILSDPELLIADEPTSGLDPVARRHFLELISDLSKVDGKTVFFSNHVVGEVEKICNRMIILSKGKKVSEGSLEDILKTLPASNRYILTAENVSLDYLKTLPGIYQVEELRSNNFGIETTGSNSKTPEFLKLLVNNPEIYVNSFTKDNINLEDIFFEVIAKEVKS